MAFLSMFQKNMKTEIDKTNERLDGKLEDINEKVMKMDKKIYNSDVKMMKLKKKIYNSDRKSTTIQYRMEERLMKLEKAMENSVNIRTKSNQLASTLREEMENLQVQPTGWNQSEASRGEGKDRVASPVEAGNFTSDWAREVNAELSGNAQRMEEQWRGNKRRKQTEGNNEIGAEGGRERQETRREDDGVVREIDWKILCPASWKQKVRKPARITHWFGEESSPSDSSSEEGGDDWNEVNREEKQRRKRVKQGDNRKRKKREAAKKASMMMGLGPIHNESRDYFEKRTNTKHDARKMAVKELLMYNLAFNEKEFHELDIQETKDGKDGIIYIAAGNKDMLKEIYRHKADSRNDDIEVMNYIPPCFYQCFKAISKEATRQRAEDKNLKTQLRFGPKDVEVYTKERGGDEGYKEVDLEDFMSEVECPPFDHTIRWKKHSDRLNIREIDYNRSTRRPSKAQGPSAPTAQKDTRYKIQDVYLGLQ